MTCNIKQISNMHKIRASRDLENISPISEVSLFQGETFHWQVALTTDRHLHFSIKLTSQLKDYTEIYQVGNAMMDMPAYSFIECTDYITKEPGFMPDVLMPFDTEKDNIRVNKDAVVLWIKLKLPKDIPAGKYDVTLEAKTFFPFGASDESEAFSVSTNMTINVLPEVVPEQKTKFTQWFHSDCISSVHNVEIFSEKHWDLIDKYMSMASEFGINMILTPIITPPLDTAEGIRRPNVQLVKIEKSGDKYSFDFSLLKRWVDLAKKNNMKYFEISHLFSQWGLKYAPNIYVYENGIGSYMFGWHVSSKAEEYADFLKQFIPAVIEFLKSEEIANNCYFHISDEPNEEHLESYNYAKSIIKPLIGNIKTIDALSTPEFYTSGVVEIPVPAINKIGGFLSLDVPERWTYYCCSQGEKVTNRFLSMPLGRTRIIGLQMYKYGIEGFLQWGYNYYYSQFSRSLINPYITTSANNAFPSGDTFSVYPGADGPLPSIRGYVFKQALQDIELCRMLESKIGHDAVVSLIEEVAGMSITFEEYPSDANFIPKVMDIIKEKIKG